MSLTQALEQTSPWGDAANATATVTGIVTSLVLIVTLIFSIRRERAAAKRAEAAARLTEAYSQRAVDALEALAARGGSSTTPIPLGVRWSLVHFGGDTYKLENGGDVLARQVDVKADDSLHLQNLQGGPDVAPGEAMTFLAVVTLGTRDSTIRVSWVDDKTDSGSLSEWAYPLPPRPARH